MSPDPPPLPPIWKRSFQLFLAPGELFAALAATPLWLGALLLAAAIVAASAVAIPTELYESAVRAFVLERRGEMPSDPERVARFQRFSAIGFSPIYVGIRSLFYGGLCTLVFPFILGRRGRFRQYFSASTHATIIVAVGALVIVPFRIAAGDVQLLLSPGNALRGILSDSYALDVLRSLDVFAIWAQAALAIAVAKIDPQQSFGGALTILLLPTVGFALIAANFL